MVSLQRHHQSNFAITGPDSLSTVSSARDRTTILSSVKCKCKEDPLPEMKGSVNRKMLTLNIHESFLLM